MHSEEDMNGYILLHSRRRLAPTARLRVHLCVHRCGDLDRQRVAFAALDRLAPDGGRFLRSRGPATRSVPMALARQLAKHCRHGYWSQRSLLCVKVTATRAQTGVDKGLRGSDRHRPCGEDAHRELGQMSCGRRKLASRPFYFAIVFWSSYHVPGNCTTAKKTGFKTTTVGRGWQGI